jgi:hypothetical protein
VADDDELDDADYFVADLLFQAIGKPRREAAIRGLLAGNDTQCFTTEAYRVAYDRLSREEHERRVRDYGWLSKFIPLAWEPGLAEMHLRTSGLVREVSPAVWAPVEGVSRA